MSNYNVDRIQKPKYFGIRPLTRGRGDRTAHVVGFDTEAIGGRPVMMQFSEAGGADAAEIILLKNEPNAALRAFVNWVDEHCTSRKQEHLIFGFNLTYEWTQLFGDLPSEITAVDEIKLALGHGEDDIKWQLVAWNHARHAMSMTDVKSQRVIQVIDAGAFFPGSLDAVAKMVGIERKDPIDKAFLRSLSQADLLDPVFQHYAKQDAVVTRLIGEKIVAMHEETDLPTCRTAPQFASRVFRKNFLQGVVDLPIPALEQAGLWSYHGGKNGFYLPKPTETPAWNLDIVSAYPHAMRALPAIEGSTWKKEGTYVHGGHALWHVRFRHHPCRFNGALTHGGQKLPGGEVTFWLTGYELDVMVERNEARSLEVIDGWVMQGESNGGGLVDYVDRFFAQKQTAVGPERATAKLLLNSLYGKFFQKTPVGSVRQLQSLIDQDTYKVEVWVDNSNPLQQYDYRAGGLYHPPVASLITGFVRARIHRLEHAYWAMATSTDGLFARKEPPASEVGSGLGMLTAEYGTLCIWRERLYEFRLPPGGYKVKPYSKVALHGFRAGSEALRQIPLTPGAYRYEASHPVTLKEATHQLGGRRYRPGEFANLTFTLDLKGT